MATAPILDNAVLRGLETPRDLALYLRRQSATIPTEQMTRHLIESVESEALSPEVFAVYLSTINSPSTVVAAVKQPFSRFVRYAAIKRVGRAMRTPRWEVMWDAFGGVPGLISLLSELAVVEVGMLCKAIGWFPRRENAEKQQRVTQLLQGLLPDAYPHAPYRTEDERPLAKRYAYLVPACTSDFVRKMFAHYAGDDDEGPFHWDKWNVRRIAQFHWPMLQQLVLDTLGPEDNQPAPEMVAEDKATASLLDCFLPHLLDLLPPLPGRESGSSFQMSFSLRILRKFAAGAEAGKFDRKLESVLVVPLMRRALEKEAKGQSIREIIDLTLVYLGRHPNICNSLFFTEDSFIAYVAKAWSMQPETFESHLIAAIKRQSYGQSEFFGADFGAFTGILDMVKVEQRYRLLRLVIMSCDALGVDIDNDRELETCPIKTWPPDLFLRIVSDQGRDLLHRLIRLKPDEDFLLPSGPPSVFPVTWSIMLQPPTPNSFRGDPKLLQVLLNSKGNHASHDARVAVEKHRTKASKSREQTDRAFYARSATFYAIASGSLDLYAQVMTWLRRFLRDPLTAKAIWCNETMGTNEGIALLSGVSSSQLQYGKHYLSERIVKANEILVHLFETAVEALNEPSFHSRDNEFMTTLFEKVMTSRMTQSCPIKDSLDLTDDDVYDILWSPTLDMLLKVEKMGLQSANESLEFNSPNWQWFRPSLSSNSVAVNRFIDKLAVARDQLWQRHRLTLHSECAVLPKIWPRGLPIQCLIASPIDAVSTHAAKPYIPLISSRADSIVMTEQNPLVSEETLDEEKKDTIGRFVDSYELALEVDVLLRSPGEQQQDRASAILAHLLKLNRENVMDVNGKPRLSKLEALRFWKPIFRRVLPSVQVTAFDEIENQDRRSFPTLPSNLDGMDSQERLEWNPDADRLCAVRQREIPSTLIDCMLAAGPLVRPGSMTIPKVYTQTFEPPSIWSGAKQFKLKGEPNSVKDGTLLSALLFLASKVQNKPNILISAFPSQQDVRYPVLFLDQEFLESAKNEDEQAREVILQLRHRTPSTLLHMFVTKAISSKLDEKNSTVGRLIPDKSAFNLLKILSQTDRHGLASQDILRIVLDRPDSSSWHREILTPSLPRRLSKAHAQELMQHFSSSIHSKLDQQRTLREQKGNVNPSLSQLISDPPPKSLIKITTIKFWARFLNDTDVIPTKHSLQLLSSLLLTSDHVDARVAVVESLLARLAACKDESESEEQVLSALRDFVPVIGAVNERQQLDEKAWQEAERTGALPEISDDDPILSTIFRIFDNGYYRMSWDQRLKLLYQILLPAVQLSKQNNARWLLMYMRKYHPEQESHASAIALPLKPNFLCRLLMSNMSQMPSWILADFQKYVLLNIQPPNWLVNLNHSILTNSEHRESNSNQHWLSLFNKGPEAIRVNILREWQEPSDSSDGAGIELAYVQECVLEQAMALLRLNDPYFTQWKSFVTGLYPLLVYRNDHWRPWRANMRPVLAQLVTAITELRNSQTWRHGSKSDDAPKTTEYRFLPPTFPLRLKLLDHPHLSDDHDVEPFASQLLSLLSEVQSLGLAHHGKLQEIADAALSADGDNLRVRLACRLGEIKGDQSDQRRDAKSSIHAEENTIEEREAKEEEFQILRVELADRLFEQVKFKKVNTRVQRKSGGDEDKEGEGESDKSRVKRILQSWAKSGVEEIRMRGVRSARRLELDVES